MLMPRMEAEILLKSAAKIIATFTVNK